MAFRKTVQEDIPQIMEIIRQAQSYLKEQGIDQWQDGYPSREIVLTDIDLSRSYSAVIDGEICGTFVLVDDGEVTYDKIYDGHWITGDDSQSYVAIHRVAISVKNRGQGVSTPIINYAADYAKALGRSSLRIDTHEGNKVMRRMLEKHGFTYCGIIYLENGHSRVAYEKTL